jgi:hypothetical protein
LQDELTPEVEDKDVTVRPADKTRDIKSLISYAVGCMFGRYSLDVDGLVYAGGEWDGSKYTTFVPDRDNVLPICDDEYFDDDIAGRFVDFVKTLYGEKVQPCNYSLQFTDDSGLPVSDMQTVIADRISTNAGERVFCVRFTLKQMAYDPSKIPSVIALASVALGKPTLSSLAVLGEISISGTILKVEELASVLQVCIDSGAKKVLVPITSAADIGTVPSDLIGAFSLIFYSTPQEAVFKALGVE